jgi:hypothetical protein
MLHEAHSYWEGEADRVVEVLWALDGRPRVWRDALPLWLRAAVASDRVPPKVWMLPGQLGSRSPIEATRPVEASLGVRDGGALSRATGRADSTRLVVVTSAADTSRYWFDAAWPHVLLRWESNARTLELTKTLRLDYWTHDALADEALLR